MWDPEKLAGIATVALAISTGLMAVRRYIEDRAMLSEKLARLEVNAAQTNEAIEASTKELGMVNAKLENLIGQMTMLCNLWEVTRK